MREYINKKEYLSGFNINKDLFNKRMNAFYETCAFLSIINVDDFVYRRALDKSLMIYGGFSKSNLVVFTDGIIN